jgi:hypothetical protein
MMICMMRSPPFTKLVLQRAIAYHLEYDCVKVLLRFVVGTQKYPGLSREYLTIHQRFLEMSGTHLKKEGLRCYLAAQPPNNTPSPYFRDIY